MKELIDKISSYNLFNYLLPGVTYVGLTQYLTDFDLILENNFIGAFLYYFIGLVISRIGSLIIEPTLKKWKFVIFSAYNDFIEASKKDEKIELFSEVNNTYRTLTSLFLVMLVTIGVNKLFESFTIAPIWLHLSITLLLVFLFAYSYKKQTSYITKRIEHHKNKPPND